MADNTIYLTEDTFEDEVLKSPIPVLVDFYADWCGPCKALGPVIDSLSDKYKGKAKICKLNIDQHRNLAIAYRVMSIPTLFFIKDGEIKERITGALPQPAIEEKLDALL
ncbi:MAG: thioredoxin [Clostridiales bacterium]|jgi:thioredoxin 1|nr:thioredoxin [Clostridiales bacterium]